MSEYQQLTSKIQVPREWPVEVGRNMFIYLVQKAIYRHRLGQRIVVTVEKVSALVTSDKNKPGYLLEKIEEINDEETYRIDLLIPVRTALVTFQSSDTDTHSSNQESQCLPMILKSNHPISKMFGPRSDRHKIVTAVPNLKKILQLKGITGSELYNYSLRTTYRIHKDKWLDQIVVQEEPSPSTSAGPSTSTEPITDDEWDFDYYERLPPAHLPSVFVKSTQTNELWVRIMVELKQRRFWCNLKVAYPWIQYSMILVLIILVIYLFMRLN